MLDLDGSPMSVMYDEQGRLLDSIAEHYMPDVIQIIKTGGISLSVNKEYT